MHRRGNTGALRLSLASRRWPRRMLLTVNILVAICLIGAASAYGYVAWRFGQIHTKNLPALSQINGGSGGGGGGGSGSPFTLLVVGSDSRAALSGPDNGQFGAASAVGGQRSDTIILVRVVPSTRQLMMMSIPRDLWGPIPGQGSNRINTAFDTGANLLIQTIEQDLNVPVNHYVEVNFDTFRDISNAVGGVNFYFPTPARDTLSDLSIPAPGCYSLKGDQALAFVRSRHYQYYQNGSWQSEGLSDLARIQRQQAFIKKMIKKSEGEFTNPIALNDIIGGVTKNLTVDKNFGTGLMLSLVKDFRSMNVEGIPNMTLPTYGYTTAGGAEVLGLQQPQATQAIAAFNSFGTKPPAKKSSSSSKSKSVSSTTAVTAPKVTVAPRSVNIEVANGTGQSGQAGQLSRFLAGLGYHAGITSSSGYGHSTTEILYAPDALTAAQQLKAQIPGGATLVASPALTPTSYNVKVVTGSTYTNAAGSGSGGGSGASAGAGVGASSSTSAAGTPGTSTTVPGSNPALYQLPGFAPGQTTPANC